MKKEHNISKFNVPEGYFKTFEEQLFSKISEEKFPKTNGFTVPPAYFENIEERVLKTVESSEQSKKVIPLFPKKYFGYAAAIAACFLIGFSLYTNTQNDQNLDSLQWSSIDSYIEGGNLNLDLYDLTSIIDDSDISGVEVQKWELAESDVKDYLFENIDTENLTNER
ncbi:hypothetical protein [Aequorivita capsosiphonis]|uniref:hypothetical protein n=1 Tax=Aequorivita capsosiphonis TaxID=487317 RepID=UPI0003F6E348|nr:hypothetical protein [Aequorivita capsosiphonis]